MTDLLALSSSTAAVIGLVLIYLRLRAYERFSKSTLVSDLARDFESHHKTQMSLMPGGILTKKDVSPSGEDFIAVLSYLDFFEKIHFLVRHKAVNISDVEEMFLYRFLIAIHNPAVQDHILYSPELGPRFSSAVILYNKIIYHLAHEDKFFPEVGRRLDLHKCHENPEWPDG